MRLATMALLLTVGAITSAMVVYATRVMPSGELGQKREWATLQGVEFAHRRDADAQMPVVLFNPVESPYVILGIPTRDEQSPRVWVILNEVAPDSSAYILPKDRAFYLPCSYLAALASKTKIVSEVSKLLGSGCIS
jgi:hypothetical protein